MNGMATFDDALRLALTLPATTGDDTGVSVAGKGFAWAWRQRLDPKKARVPNFDVIAVRTANEAEKQELLATDPEKFFTETHYNGFPAILVRLAAIDEAELMEVLTDGWRTKAPRKLVKEFEADGR
jgi:hypothetical protein